VALLLVFSSFAALLASFFDVAMSILLEFGRRGCLRPWLLLLKVLVVVDVRSCVFQLEADVMAAVIARRKWLAPDACHFMGFTMNNIVDDRINSRRLACLARFENVTYSCHVHSSLPSRPEHGRIALRGRLFHERLESG